MKKFETYFCSLYLLSRISEANFVRFMEDHLQRLMANNPGGKYTPLITAITTMLEEYRTLISQRSLNQALQESKTKSVDQSISAFRTLLSNTMYQVREKWPEGSPVYEEFFPQGTEEYQQALKGNISTKIGRWIDVCKLHGHDLPEDFVVPFEGIKTDLDTNRAAQLNLMAITDGKRVEVAGKRTAIEQQATRNLLTLALDFLGMPEKVPVYFDQSILYRPLRTNGNVPEPEVLSNAVAPKSSVVILHGGFDANTLFHIVNSGSVNLKFYTAGMPDDPLPGSAPELAPGEEDDVIASELGSSGNLFLMAYNGHETTAGSYEITLEAE